MIHVGSDNDLFRDAYVWHIEEPQSVDEAEAIDGFTIGKWYVVDRKRVLIDGPFDNEQEARDAVKSLGDRWRGFGPKEA